MSQLHPSPQEYDYKVVVCHSEPGAWNVGGGPSWSTPLCPPTGAEEDPKVITVGRTMFETDRLPEGWAGRINEMDEVWVPTPFHANIFSAGGVKIPISTLIETVDTAFFDPSLASPDPLSAYDIPSSAFRFLSVFKFEDRKGYDVLLSSYFEAFERGDDVALVILVSDYHSRGGREDLESFCESRGYDLPSLPPIYVLHSLPPLSLRGLYSSSSMFVLPSRGEGWGRPHVEAMSMGMPVAATNWSGPTAYMTRNNSYQIEVEGMVRVEGGAFDGHMWAEPSKEKLKGIMRRAVEDREEGREKGRRAREDMLEYYNLEAGAREIMERVEEAVKRREGKMKRVGGGAAEL
ncbi:hypothetical protein TrRE_jg3650 [Triparma retinervis]|uniref:Glycosyl transferase family 1 domain-containing protein n=1 Tax=Triparma retinervis TaxID=2557542 RepID=A0A9W7DQF2_9STRA|nr:hypothetical protein TrRE_jg3650 [Triparma retinervis]